MKKPTQRKARSKEVKNNPDFSKPILYDLSKIGTDDDCFGIHHDLQASECKMCGDSELCQIVFGQRLHIRRNKQEEKFIAKDLEDNKVSEKFIQVREYLLKKFKEKSELRFMPVYKSLNTQFFEGKRDQRYIKQIIKDLNIFQLFKAYGKLHIKQKPR